ncbi:MAG: DM13 domain-containing protein [Armatimonadetes bacterium]|nr:DM13 domain-containing protein [Armatimonadota bacterium]
MMPAMTAGRGRQRLWLLLVIAAVIVLPIAWYLISPLFLSKTVSEAFPMSANATLPAGMTREQAEKAMMEASKVNSAMTETMPAAAATVLVQGTFGAVDGVHKGEGTATLYRVGQDRVLRFDPFKVTNGPDLYVYLSGHAAPRSREQLHEGGAFEVGRLKGNIGAQNYTLPADLDPSKFKSAVIYCRRFHVVFSTAELTSR